MKAQLRFRHLAFAILATGLSLTAVAHAESPEQTTHVGFWGKVRAAFSPKIKKSKNAPEASSTPQVSVESLNPRTPSDKLLRYEVSLSDADDCTKTSERVRDSLTGLEASTKVQVTSPVNVLCTEHTASFDKGTYRTASLEITYQYLSMSYWTSRAPELNVDILGGTPDKVRSLADGKFGIFPTYQSCLDTAAKLRPDFGRQTGVAPVAFLCQPSAFGVTEVDTKPSKLEGPQLGPVGNYALVIYSAGVQSKHLYVFENQGWSSERFADSQTEINVATGLLAEAGISVIYQDGIHLAYYAADGVRIQILGAGVAATPKECFDQSEKAEQVWAALDATGGKAICIPQSADQTSLEVISLGTHITPAAGYDDLIYSTYDECMDPTRQTAIRDARETPTTQGVLCFPSGKRQGYYQAQLYWKL